MKRKGESADFATFLGRNAVDWAGGRDGERLKRRTGWEAGEPGRWDRGRQIHRAKRSGRKRKEWDEKEVNVRNKEQSEKDETESQRGTETETYRQRWRVKNRWPNNYNCSSWMFALGSYQF